jgi:hypothetical protein
LKYEYQEKGYRIKKKELEENWSKIYTAYQNAIIKVLPPCFEWGQRGPAKDLLKTARTHDGFWFDGIEEKINKVGISPKSVVPGAWKYISRHVHGEARDIFFTALEEYAKEHRVRI